MALVIRRKKTYKKTKTIIKHAIKLIEDRKNWTQGHWSLETKDGSCLYCAEGAIEALAATDKDAEKAIKAVRCQIPNVISAATLKKHGFSSDLESLPGVSTVNDGIFRKTAAGAHKLTLKIMQKAVEAS